MAAVALRADKRTKSASRIFIREVFIICVWEIYAPIILVQYIEGIIGQKVYLLRSFARVLSLQLVGPSFGNVNLMKIKYRLANKQREPSSLLWA